MNTLSQKQERFLGFIQGYALEHGRPPTYQEIQYGLKLSSPGTVHWYVQTLTELGALKRIKGSNGKRALAPMKERTMSSRLPLLGVISAGTPIEAVEFPETVAVPPHFLHPENFVLRVKGKSMIDDNIEDGDYIVARKSSTAEQGQTVVALVNGEATLKRYHRTSSGVELRPRNPAYSVIRVKEEDDFRINGVVLYSFRVY